MKLKTFALGAVIGAFSMSGAYAENPNPFADCGIGAALFKNDTAAVISNVIWDLGTTAITSATASPETCEGAEAAAAAYIHESYDNLIEDTAKGSGEYLDTLLSIVNVSEDQKSAVVQSLREKMAAEVSDASYESSTKIEKSQSYFDSLLSSISV